MSLGLRRLPLWILLGVVMLQPTPHRVSQTVAGDLGDSLFVTWTLSWGARSLTRDPLGVFDANIFHPEPQTLALSDTMLSLAPVFGLLEWLTGDPIVAFNVMMFALFVGALASAHALAMRLFGRGDVALVVAVIACCNSYVFGQQNHPQLQTFGFVSLAFLLLLRAVEHRRLRDGVWLGAVLVVLTLANVYYGMIWTLSAVVVVGVLALRGVLPAARTLVRPALGAALVAGVVLGPVAQVYREVDDRNDLTRGDERANSLLPTDLFTPQPDNWSWGTALDSINSVGKAGEHHFFPGFLAMALGAIGLVVIWRVARGRGSILRTGVRIDEVLALLVAGVLAFVFALGRAPGGLPGPYRLLHDWVPGFDAVRVTSRFAVVGFLALALLAGLAFQHLADRVPRARRTMLAAGIAAIVLIEVGGPTARVDVPEGERLLVYEELATREDGVVLELPIRTDEEGNTWAFVEAPRMYHATTDWNSRINGYSGSAPAGFEELAALVGSWPSEAAERRLDELAVRYIVLHGGTEQGTSALTPEQQGALVGRAEVLGFEASRHGEDWLIVRY